MPAVGRQCPGLLPSSPFPSHPGGAAAAPHPARAPMLDEGQQPPRPACASCSIYSCRGRSSTFPVLRGVGDRQRCLQPQAGGAQEGRGWQLCCPGGIRPQEGGSRADSRQGQHGEEWAGCRQRGQRQRCSSGNGRALHRPEGQIQPCSSSGAAGQGWDEGPAAMLVRSADSQSQAGAPRDGVGGLGSPSALGLEAKVGLAGSVWGCPGLTP